MEINKDEFKVGDRVINLQLGCGVILESDESDKNMPYRIKYDNGIILWEGSINCVKEGVVSKYDNLKSRITALNNGWDKEADDIIQEIYTSNKRHYHIVIGIDNDAHIHIVDGDFSKIGKSVCEPLSYDSQCTKLSAFKQALLWLLDHSDIKKDLVGQKVRAEIEGKIYKVIVLEEK